MGFLILMYSAKVISDFCSQMLKGEIWQEGELQGFPLLPQLIFTPDHSIFAEKFPRDFKSFSISWIKKVVRELKQQQQISFGWGEFYKSASVFGKSQHQNSLILSTSSLRKSYQIFPASENTQIVERKLLLVSGCPHLLTGTCIESQMELP